MKKLVVYVLVILFAIAGVAGCTNDEGGEDLDVITPADSTQSRHLVKTGTVTSF